MALFSTSIKMNAIEATIFSGADLAQPADSLITSLDTLLAAAPVGLAFVDEQFRFVRVNQAFCLMNGVSRQRLLGRSMEEVFPEHWPQAEHRYRSVLESGAPLLDIELSRAATNNRSELRHYLCNYYPIKSREDQIMGVGVVINDITERKRAEEQTARHAREQTALFALTDRLHHARALPEVYEAALNSILEALACNRASILLFDEVGVMHFVAWRGLSDTYRTAASGHSPWQQSEANPEPFGIEDVLESEFAPDLKAAILSEGIRGLGFIPLVNSGCLIGKFMVYYDAPHAFGKEELDLALMIGRQIAFAVERERIQAEYRRQEAGQALLAAIVNSSQDAIVSKDLNGIVTSWNTAAERIYGWEAEEIIGRSKALVIPDDLPYELPAILEKIRLGLPIEHYETRRIRKDSTLIDVDISVSPVRDSNGQIIGAATIVRDITERRRTEKELLQRQSEVEALNVRLKRAMQETHHRVKNNLQVISAMVDMQTIEHLSEGVVPLKEFERLNTHIRTLALVHDLLTQSVRESEQEQRISSRNALGRLLSLLEKLGGNCRIHAQIENVELLSKQLVTLSLTLNELVSNAIKHAPGDVTVRFQVHGSQAQLIVCDSGTGFPSDFDPLIAAHTGLELVLGLVESDLKGTIVFENGAEGGGCVRILFPLPEQE